MDGQHIRSSNTYRETDRAPSRAAAYDVSRPAYFALMTIYLGFAAFAAYEVAKVLLEA